MSIVNGPQAAFGVGFTRVGDGGLAMDQYVGTAVTDHRGLVEMPAYAVMAESVTSGAYWYSFAEPVATVQSWLALTAGAPAQVGDRLTGHSRLAHRDESYGTSTVAVTKPGGGVVCSGVARAVRVGRTTAELQAIDKDELSAAATEVSPSPRPHTPASPVDPGLDGASVLSGMRRGTISMGPLAELLAMTLATEGPDPVLGVDPQPWMANPLGAIQGGVIASILAQACSLAGQAHSGAGERYTVADLTVFYFRSPAADGALTVSTGTERVGRRLATVSATLADPAGTRYAHAVADIAFDRARAF